MSEFALSHAQSVDSVPDGFRILIATHYYAPHIGGIEVVAQHEAERLAAAGHDVSVLTSAIGSHPGEDELGSVHIRRIRAGNVMERRFGAPFPLFSPSLLWQAWGMVRAADIVHIHDVQYMGSWVVALWCRLLQEASGGDATRRSDRSPQQSRQHGPKVGISNIGEVRAPRGP